MIDKHYIDSAIKIREEYLGLDEKLNKCKEDLRKTSDKLLEESDNLNILNDNLGSYNSPEEAQEAVFIKLNDIDIHIKKLNAIYKPISERLEELKKQEVILYNNIKKSYTELSDEDIINELNEYLYK